MNEDQFWDLIQKVHDASKGDMDVKCELMTAELHKLNDDELKSYVKHFHAAEIKAYHWDLWAAAYHILGGCSDDGFSDFRASLISCGKGALENALKDPNSLASVFKSEEEAGYEGFQYCSFDVEEERFGEVIDRDIPFPDDPTGEEFDEDELEARFPRLKQLD